MDQLLSQGRLLQPSTSGADMAAPVDAQTGTAIAHQIHLISTAMRYCDTFSRESSDHPVLSALQFCWALLQEAAARGTSEMLLAVYELYGRAMACLRGLLSPLLPQLLNQLSATYCRTPIVGCLTCLTQVCAISHSCMFSCNLVETQLTCHVLHCGRAWSQAHNCWSLATRDSTKIRIGDWSLAPISIVIGARVVRCGVTR